MCCPGRPSPTQPWVPDVTRGSLERTVVRETRKQQQKQRLDGFLNVEGRHCTNYCVLRVVHLIKPCSQVPNGPNSF